MAIRKLCVRFTDCILFSTWFQRLRLDSRYCKRAGSRSQLFGWARPCVIDLSLENMGELRGPMHKVASTRRDILYLRQKAGVKITSSVKSSSRPSSIANVQTQVWKSFSTAKVDAGPTRPRPGPVLLM